MWFFLILIGLFNIFFPRAAWYLEIGWKIKDSEPSEGALIFHRVIGVIFCIAGIFSI
ncbi:MAG TPA: hypothetical protein GXX53_03230 [Tissierellia bacterium]|nr:hypothetical protein [Tissierellia bacterium]